MTTDFVRKRIQDIVDEFIASVEQPRILEAGCGSVSHLRFPPKATLVGIDIMLEQLQKNQLVHEKILGDIQTYPLPSSSFDIIVCWDVIEHLPYPTKAIANFAQALKPNGLLIIVATNVLSLKGLITKFTPHWLHVWVYRYIFRDPHAGKPGNAPFKVFLRFAAAPGPLRRFSKRVGLEPLLFEVVEGRQAARLQRSCKPLYSLYVLLNFLCRLVTIGRWNSHQADIYAVFRKVSLSKE